MLPGGTSGLTILAAACPASAVTRAAASSASFVALAATRPTSAPTLKTPASAVTIPSRRITPRCVGGWCVISAFGGVLVRS